MELVTQKSSGRKRRRYNGVMTIAWDAFERYRQKGLDARRAGQWDSARIYFLEAARAMSLLAREAVGDELQEARRQTGQGEDTAEGEGSPDAQQGIVREKPSLRFNDVAGLDRVKEDIRLKMVYP